MIQNAVIPDIVLMVIVNQIDGSCWKQKRGRTNEKK